MRARLLVLAGTAEARAVLCRAHGLPILASLAGRTACPRDLGHPTRVGGFGGEDGFRDALRGMRAVLDATHPFAAAISERAARVAAQAGVAHLRLTRPPWPVEPGWTRHPSVAACAAALPPGARAFLATGPGTLDAFAGRDVVARRVDPAPPRAGVAWVVGPPGDRAAEAAAFRAHGITHLVSKNSGGRARAKLDAARDLGIAVHVIDRPPPAPGRETHDVEEAVRFLRAHG